MKVRNIEKSDWDGIVALERQTYLGGLSESRIALTSKISAAPSFCFVLESGGKIAGYLISLPYPRFLFPHLNQAESRVYRSRNLHVHDTVIAERYRGQCLAGQLLENLILAAEREGFLWLSLVAVSGADIFWKAQGFEACPEVVLPESYGEEAVYMSREMPVKISMDKHQVLNPQGRGAVTLQEDGREDSYD